MLALGEIWEDPVKGPRLGCLDAANPEHIALLMGDRRATLAVQDPPYNQVAFEQMPIDEYIAWSSRWVDNSQWALTEDASLYLCMAGRRPEQWISAAAPDFMLMMRGKPKNLMPFNVTWDSLPAFCGRKDSSHQPYLYVYELHTRTFGTGWAYEKFMAWVFQERIHDSPFASTGNKSLP